MEVFSSEKRRRHDYFLKIVQKRIAEVKNIHRIILIGTGESGKSTFVKQLKLLSSLNQTFPDKYREIFIPEIQRNLIQSLASIMTFMEQENIHFTSETPPIMRAKRFVYDLKGSIDKAPDSIFNYTTADDGDKRNKFFDNCAILWADRVVKETQLRGNEFQQIDCAQYFLDKIEDIRDPRYKPSDDDVLQSRTKTLGIHTESIVFNNVHFELVDVGGQREQRAKWIEAISDGVTAVIFLTDVSAYDMMLAEDHSVNRLRESINLLGQVWTKSPLRDKSIILFLNKQDKLEKKVRDQRYPIDVHFPEYNVGKVTFLVQFLRDLRTARGGKLRKDAEVWDQYFSYYLPPTLRSGKDTSQRQSTMGESSKASLRDTQISTEFNQIQSMVAKAFSDNLIQSWPLDGDEEDHVAKQLIGREDFSIFLRRLLSIPFYQVVSITSFIQRQFVAQCEQSALRQIYSFPTTAIDKRNVDRVFESCKDILQGKALTDLMV